MMQTTLTQSGAPCCVIAGPISHGSLQCQPFILDLSLIDLLLIFPIWMCQFDSMVSLGVEFRQSSFQPVVRCFVPVFWYYFEYKIAFLLLLCEIV